MEKADILINVCNGSFLTETVVLPHRLEAMFVLTTKATDRHYSQQTKLKQTNNIIS